MHLVAGTAIKAAKLGAGSRIHSGTNRFPMYKVLIQSLGCLLPGFPTVVDGAQHSSDLK